VKTICPNQWTHLRAHDGAVTLGVRVADVDAEIVFSDRDLDDLRKHVTMATAQRRARRRQELRAARGAR
jgi:hypothetical protein